MLGGTARLVFDRTGCRARLACPCTNAGGGRVRDGVELEDVAPLP